MNLLLLLLSLVTALAKLANEALEVLTTAQGYVRLKRKKGHRR